MSKQSAPLYEFKLGKTMLGYDLARYIGMQFFVNIFEVHKIRSAILLLLLAGACGFYYFMFLTASLNDIQFER